MLTGMASGLRVRLHAEDARSVAHRKGLIVVSTFEISQHGLAEAFGTSADVHYPMSQSALAGLFANGTARPFSLPQCRKAPLEAAAWLRAEGMTEVAHEEYFEPYVMASRRGLPRFDERFRGYR